MQEERRKKQASKFAFCIIFSIATLEYFLILSNHVIGTCHTRYFYLCPNHEILALNLFQTITKIRSDINVKTSSLETATYVNKNYIFSFKWSQNFLYISYYSSESPCITPTPNSFMLDESFWFSKADALQQMKAMALSSVLEVKSYLSSHISWGAGDRLPVWRNSSPSLAV